MASGLSARSGWAGGAQGDITRPSKAGALRFLRLRTLVVARGRSNPLYAVELSVEPAGVVPRHRVRRGASPRRQPAPRLAAPSVDLGLLGGVVSVTDPTVAGRPSLVVFGLERPAFAALLLPARHLPPVGAD